MRNPFKREHLDDRAGYEMPESTRPAIRQMHLEITDAMFLDGGERQDWQQLIDDGAIIRDYVNTTALGRVQL